MDWSPIGGDPAPGSTSAVRSAASVLAEVASLARDARRSVQSSTHRLGSAVWRGEAADAFRSGVSELPGVLEDVDVSFSQAGAALLRYRDVLDEAQTRAASALASAQQASAALAAARTRESAARSTADAARRAQVSAQADTVRLQAQQAVTLDPAQRAALDGPVSAARARATRHAAERTSADGEVARHRRTAQVAQDQWDDARRRAEDIRDQLRAAAGTAVAALAAAEEAGHLPGFLERAYQDTRSWVVEYGPQAADLLSMASSVFMIAAMVFPPAAPVLLGVSLVLGGASLLLTVGSHAWSEEGMTPGAWVDVGLSALSLAGTALGLGVAVKGAQAVRVGAGTVRGGELLGDAFTLRKVAEGVGHVEDVVEIAQGGIEGYEEGGVAGAVLGTTTAVGTYVIGDLVSDAAAGDVVEAFRGANADPVVRDELTAMSRALRAASETPSTMNLGLGGDAVTTRDLQSLLGTGNVPPGGFLPGNHATSPVHGSVLDHAASGAEVHDYVAGIAQEVFDLGTDAAEFGADADDPPAPDAAPAGSPRTAPTFDPEIFWAGGRP